MGEYKKILENIIVNLTNFYVADVCITLNPKDIAVLLKYLKDLNKSIIVVEDKSITEMNDGLDW